MSIRHIPRILEPNAQYKFWHDWRHGDYTKISNTINYCKVDISNIPKEPGLYMFYENDDLLYIGISNNLRYRIGTHVSLNKHITRQHEPPSIAYHIHRVTRIEYYLYPKEDLAWIELFYITKLHPRYNE